MKKTFTTLLLIAAFGIWMPSAKAQTTSPALDYLQVFGNMNPPVVKTYLEYIAAVAHNKSARKIEKRRKALLNMIETNKNTVRQMGAFKGDNALKSSGEKYLDVLYKVFNEDYEKIVNMEDVAEQSYDEMEAYLLAQEKANERLQMEEKGFDVSYEAFANKNNITLIKQETEQSKKLELVNRVQHYSHQMYLVFFKSYKQEAYVLDAIQREDMNAFEQNKNALLKNATKGLAVLDTMKIFGNDASLKTACKQALQFYKTEASEKLTVVSDYFLTKSNFDKIKKSMDAKGNKRTKEDVDTFNAEVNKINQASTRYNQINQEMNNGREVALNNWNKAQQNFLDTYSPK